MVSARGGASGARHPAIQTQCGMTRLSRFRTCFLAMSSRLAAALVCVVALASAEAQETADQTFDDTFLALLAHPDRSSPRSTLHALQQDVRQAYSVLASAYDEHRHTPGFIASDDVKKKVTTAQLLLRQAMTTLDLSQVPAVDRERVGIETVLLLKEIFDRLPTTPADSIPGPDDVGGKDGKPALQVWSLPYAEIQIVRIADGQEAGRYLFSSGTVARVPEFYRIIKDFSQRPNADPDFFDFYTLTPGHLLPPKWYLWIEGLPAWTRLPLAGQAVWQWVGLVVVVVALCGVYAAVWRLPHRRIASAAPVRRAILRLSMMVLIVLATLAAQWLVSNQLNITGWPFIAANTTFYSIATLAAASAGYFAFACLSELIIASPRINSASADASLLRITARVLGIAASVAIILYGAREVGISLYGVLAGLGVGGLALGLAARPTLENLIGGLTLYADRPVHVGDFCEFNGAMGTVEEIGLRSTRVRARDRTLITIPNAEFSNMQLVNWSRRDQALLSTTLGLRYETTPEQMREVTRRVRELFLDHPDVDRDKVRVRFRELGQYTLGIEIHVYFNTTDIARFLEVQEELLLAIMQIVEDCGTEMAFPSTTTYHVMDGGKVSTLLRGIARRQKSPVPEHDESTEPLPGSTA